MTAAIILAVSTSGATAGIGESQTFAGPLGVWGEDSPNAVTLAATFTATQGGVPYTPRGIRVSMDLTSNVEITWAYDIVLEVTPPVGPSFTLLPGDDLEFTVIFGANDQALLPASIQAAGTWHIKLYDVFVDGSGEPDAFVSNLNVSLLPLSAPEPPVAETDLGTLSDGAATYTVSDYSGVDIVWIRFEVPTLASGVGDSYVDINTVGTSIGPGASGLADDTMLGLYDSNGVVIAVNDDISPPDDVRSYLSFGSATPRVHDGSDVYRGAHGPIYAGVYYLAAAPYRLDVNELFWAGLDSTSSGGAFQVNVYSRFAGPPCSPADLGATGGVAGHDRVLDNNDVVAFIDQFFAQTPASDLGGTGGTPGADGAWDNNDFVLFIDFFFADQADCTG